MELGHQVKKLVKFLNRHNSVNFWATSSINSSKCRECHYLTGWYNIPPVTFLTKKFATTSKFRHFAKILSIQYSINEIAEIKRPCANYAWKIFFMMMTSLTTSQRDDKVSLLYSCLNEISAFSCIIHERFDKSSPNWIHICTGSLVPASYLDN